MPETRIFTALAVFFPLGVLMILSAFHLLLFLAYREERYNLYFVLLALSLAVNDLASGIPSLINLPPASAEFLKIVFRISASLVGLTMLLSVYSTLHERIPKRFYRLDIPVLMISLFNAIIPTQWSIVISFAVVCFLIIEVSRTAYQALVNSLTGSYILGLGTLIFVSVSLFYWLIHLLGLHLNEVESIFFTLSDMLIMPITMALWTSVRFANTYRQLALQTEEVRALSEAMLEKEQIQREMIEQQNHELERLVQERTAQLQEKMSLLASANEEIQRQVEVQAQQSAEIQFANARLQEQNERLNNLNSEKNEFLGIVAHDLKNPLGNIMMLTEMMRGTTIQLDDERKGQALEQVILTSRKMHKLIENLLDINKIEQGNLSLQCVVMDFAAKVRLITNDFIGQAEKKHITVATHIPEQALIFADTFAIGQIIENLLSNAIKYSPLNKTINVEMTEHQEQSISVYRLSIQDQGPGLSETELPLLFGKFVRLSAQPTAGEHSTGLGLSIVKRLVEAMQGQVWCESTLGVGSRFIVAMPKANV